MTIRQFAKEIKKNISLHKIANEGNKSIAPIYLYNFWQDSSLDTWLARFMRFRGISTDKRISLYSVFGDREVIKFDKRDIKLFITAENIHFGNFKIFSDNMLASPEINLSMGFDKFDDERYLRFPLWMRVQFAPEMSENDIIHRIQDLRYPVIGKRSKFASLISRYDWGGTRSAIYEQLKHIDKIYCPSDVLHNDDTLRSKFKDNKDAYMRQFYFNICPENSNADGYVTEKIFDAISAGCIPIYWGSYNEPEKHILNQDAIILWNSDKSNDDNVRNIETLYHNKSIMYDFLQQPRVNGNAEEMIVNFFDLLETKLRTII